LWKLADGRAESLQTVYLTCDGTVQSYTFTGLAAGARYRVVFSYTESGARRMSGAFNVEGVTAEIEEDLHPVPLFPGTRPVLLCLVRNAAVFSLFHIADIYF
ncbi:hypothetical protein, partial [Ruthenibacterium lactatiformans]|uniref:hypothetical protein n=1 Tax=Ruthenibacterium lactatiformans TaxID=1550024 RepID=UPI00210E120B